MSDYRYSTGISYIFLSIGKQCMYLLFLQTLIKTFKRSLFQIAPCIHKSALCLIFINFIFYLMIGYCWMDYLNSFAHYIWYLTLATVPIELFYSLSIIGLFGRKLFRVNVTRINEQNTKPYAKAVRRATLALVNEHKQNLKLVRTASVEMDDDLNTGMGPPSPRSLSQPEHPVFTNSTSGLSVLQLTQTPSLRQPKSINIHRFNKENKKLLDEYQLSIIDTAAKYTVLCSVAFLTSLQATILIGTAEVLYSIDKVNLERLDFAFIMLFIAGLSAVVCDVCVLLRYKTEVLTKIYRILCCGPAFCCTHCFLYCSIRRVMITVEDKLAEKIEAECETEIGAELQNVDTGTITHSTEHTATSTGKLGLGKLATVHQQIPSGSGWTAAATQSPYPSEQGGATPYSYDVDQDNDSKMDGHERPQIKRLNITVTSPENEDVDIVFAQMGPDQNESKDGDEDESSFSEDMDGFVVFAPRQAETGGDITPSVSMVLSSSEDASTNDEKTEEEDAST
eukprot:526706_1